MFRQCRRNSGDLPQRGKSPPITGFPPKPSNSGFGGKRTSDRVDEPSRLRGGEGCVVRSDDGQHRVCLVCGNAAARLPHTFRAEARTHFIYIWRNNHEKERYQIQHPHGS